MSSRISTETHKTYAAFHLDEMLFLIAFVDEVCAKARASGKAPYGLAAFLRHAGQNKFALYRAKAQHDKDTLTAKVPANMLFWMFRAGTVLNVVCPVPLPHVCKVPHEDGEQFFVVSKEEWIQERETAQEKIRPITIADHAKVQYLQRVLGINVDAMLAGFPLGELSNNPIELDDGRKKVTVGDFTYILDGNTCVTVLHKAMEIK